MTEEQIIRAALSMKRNGLSAQQIIYCLMDMGVSTNTASATVLQIAQEQRP